MMDNRYREELDQIRLTEESKGALLRAMTERRAVPEKRSRRVPLRRLAALAACAVLVLGLVNYPALAAGAERVFRYFFGVGAAEQEASLLIQGEPLSLDDGETLYLIEGAYQRDEVLTVPLDVLYRSEPPSQTWEQRRYRLTVYGADGEALTQVVRAGGGELQEVTGAASFSPSALEGSLSWLSQTYLPQGYVSAASNVFLMELSEGGVGPYTFALDAYTVSGGWEDTLWEGTLVLDTPQALDTTEASRTFAEGTVTALVGADGRSVAFYGELAPRLSEREEELYQLVIPTVWFVDEAGNRYEGYMRRYAPSEDYLPELRLAGEPEGEIVAVEVEQVYFSILRTGRLQEGETRQYSSDYTDLGWVISLS